MENLKHEVGFLKDKKFTCPPVKDSYSNIKSATGEEGLLGYTKIDKSSKLLCAPIVVSGKGATCTFKKISVSLSITSKYAKAQEFSSGLKMKLPNCGRKDIPIYFRITKGIEKSAKAGEKEHCDDLGLAFNRTIKPCASELNKFAGTVFTGKNDVECHKKLVLKLGFDPFKCTDEFLKMAKKTDDRDTNGWHTFDTILISKNCNKIVAGFEKSKKTNKIGDPAVAPNKYIPAATKCARKRP